MKKTALFCTLILASLAFASSALAGATLSFGEAEWVDQTHVRVPVYANVPSSDIALQAISLKVVSAPADAVTEMKVSRAGITRALAPLFEANPVHANTASLVVSFDETTARVPYTSSDDVVAVVELTVSDAARPVRLSFDPSVTALGNQAGTKALTATGGALTLGTSEVRSGGRQTRDAH